MTLSLLFVPDGVHAAKASGLLRESIDDVICASPPAPRLEAEVSAQERHLIFHDLRERVAVVHVEMTDG